MPSSIISPFPVFNDLDGTPLENGYIYIGQSNLNPETAPVNVFWDAARTIPAAQPIRTIGGFPSRNGSPSNVYVENDTYSITVRNSRRVFVYSAFDQTDAPSSVFDISTQVITATAGQTTFTLTTFTYLPGTDTLQVYRNGLRLTSGTDYLESSTSVVTMTSPAAAGDEFLFQGGSVITGNSTPGTSVSFIQAGTGAVTRNIQEKARESVSVKDFGAVGDGVADDTAAFNAAVSAVGPNGIVVVPDGTFLLNSNVTAPNVCFIVYGLLYGSGTIVGDNSTVVTYQGEPFLIPSAFGPGFKASQQMLTKSTTSHAETLCNLAVTRKTFGSGTNSPATADAAVFFNTEKDNWLTTAQEGEISGQFIVSRQGRNGDGSGILMNAKKVKAIGGTGGSIGIEIANTWVDSSETRLIHIQTLMNLLEGTGGHSGNTGYGFYAEAQAGNPFAAYYAGGMSDGGPNSPGGFQNLLVYYSNRLSNAGVLLYKIDGNGRTYAPFGTAAAPSYSFNGDEDTGIYRLSANAFGFATNGIVRWLVDSVGAFWPAADNAYSVGTASNRASVIYAATGTINTSDARSKQQVTDLSDAEKSAALAVKKALKKFKFNDAVAKKGDSARWHFGIMAQDVRDIFQQNGLNAEEYGLFCYDEWPELLEVKNEEGVIVQEARPAGSAYGIRYDELLAFVISAI